MIDDWRTKYFFMEDDRMSYHVWSTEGYGFNVHKSVEALDPSGLEQLNALIRQFFSDEKPYGPNVPEEMRPYLDDNVVCSKEELSSIFSDYEEEFSCAYGFGALIADICTWLWKKAGHDASVVAIVEDEFGDGSVYWGLGTVYPWYQAEFKSEEAVNQEISRVIFFADDIQKFSIEQGG